jgi:hypothetical protein
MGKKILRLNESELLSLIKKIVKESQEPEMEEGWLGDKFKNLKRFTTGHGDESEKEDAKEEFKKSLDEIEDEILNDIENTKYGDKSTWKKEKMDLMDEAEENNFLGELEIMYPRRTGKAFVKYHRGHSKGGRMMRDIGAGAAGGVRSGYSSTKSN